jgi:hypothetical protein
LFQREFIEPQTFIQKKTNNPVTKEEQGNENSKFVFFWANKKNSFCLHGTIFGG